MIIVEGGFIYFGFFSFKLGIFKMWKGILYKVFILNIKRKGRLWYIIVVMIGLVLWLII